MALASFPQTDNVSNGSKAAGRPITAGMGGKRAPLPDYVKANGSIAENVDICRFSQRHRISKKCHVAVPILNFVIMPARHHHTIFRACLWAVESHGRARRDELAYAPNAYHCAVLARPANVCNGWKADVRCGSCQDELRGASGLQESRVAGPTRSELVPPIRNPTVRIFEHA